MRHTGAGPERLEEPEPDSDEEDHPAVHGDDARQHQRGRRPVGLTEEPGATHLQLEGRARQRRADADGDDRDEAQDRGPAQEGPVLRVDRLRLDALGQRDAAREPQTHRLGPHGESGGAARRPGRALVVESTSRFRPRGSQSRLSCPGTTRTRWGKGGLTPGEHGPAIDLQQHCNGSPRGGKGHGGPNCRAGTEMRGPGRIRTSVGVNRQVYSLFPLATRTPTRSGRD